MTWVQQILDKVDQQPTIYFLAGAFSFLAASWSSSVSTSSGGIWIYLTTLPRTKQFWSATNWGYFSGLITLTFSSLMFKYWSTLCNVPVITTSFFSSTAISFPTRVLKNERKIWRTGDEILRPQSVYVVRTLPQNLPWYSFLSFVKDRWNPHALSMGRYFTEIACERWPHEV